MPFYSFISLICNLTLSKYFGCSTLKYFKTNSVSLLISSKILGSVSNPYFLLLSDGTCTLEDITIVDGCKQIADYAFQNNTYVKSFTMSNTIKYIGVSALYGCSNLETLVLSNQLISMGNYVFKNCSNLKNVVIPEGVTVIQNWAFENCTSLETIWIPSTVTKFGTAGGTYSSAPFVGCSTSLTIYCALSSSASTWGNNCYKVSSSKNATVKFGYTYEQYLAEIGA